MARPRVAAGALFFDEQGRVLLVQPTYKEGWDIPGGYVEPGESPLQACIREVHEELGIQPPIGPLLVVDWAPHPDEGDKLLFVFDGGVLAADAQAQISLNESELQSYAFHDLQRVGALLSSRLARRVATAATVRSRGSVHYIERGLIPEPVSP